TLPITADTTGSRSDVVAWSRAAATSFASAEGADPIAWLWGLAAAIDRVGMAGSTADATPRSPEPSELREWLDALAARALRGIEADAAYKSPSDRSRLLTRAVHAATESRLCDDATTSSLLARPAAHAGHERFYVRAVLHGHHLFQRPVPLTAALRDRAVRLLVARAMGMGDVASDAPEDVHAFPLAALETVLRGHGVAAYASDVASPGA
ncbi:MAG: YkgJ family cysteine cluster protein, partial [Deltaproteobacteria bacterium]|nr:YkgJ family cysteine cluster protein [Deltaproteobacteria bacterium]